MLDQLRFEAVLVGDAVELAVDAETPGVEGTGELGDAAALVQRDRVRAMRACVEEGADAAVLLPHDHEALVAVIEDGVVTFFWNVRGHAGQQPHARPQQLPFLGHELARVIPRRIRHVEAIVGLGLLGFERPGRGTKTHRPDGLQVRSHDGNLESEWADRPNIAKGVRKETGLTVLSRSRDYSCCGSKATLLRLCSNWPAMQETRQILEFLLRCKNEKQS
jgi:hypothetical protein